MLGTLVVKALRCLGTVAEGAVISIHSFLTAIELYDVIKHTELWSLFIFLGFLRGNTGTRVPTEFPVNVYQSCGFADT